MKQGHLSNEQAQARLKRSEKDRRREQDDDLRAVMSSPAGRRLVWRIINGWSPELAGAFSLSMTGNSHTFFNEGERAVSVSVMREAQRVSDDLYVLMLQEQLKRQKEDDLHRKDAISQAPKDE